MTDSLPRKEMVGEVPVAADIQPATPPHPEVRQLPVEKLRISEFCERSPEDDDLGDLAESLRMHGMLHPVSVMEEKDGLYSVIAGRRRVLAARELGWVTLRCQVLNVTPEEGACLAFAENAKRRPPTPVDEARFFRRMQDRFGMTEEQIAESVQLPQSTISERLSLLRLPEDLQTCIGAKSATPFNYSHAVSLARLMDNDRFGGEEMARKLHQKIASGKVPASESRAIVKLITDGDFERLPDILRHLLLTDPRMNTELLPFFCNPAGLIEADGAVGEAVKKAAGSWTPVASVKFIQECVGRGLSFADAKKLWFKRLERLADAEATKAGPDMMGKTPAQKLSVVMSDLMDAAETLKYLRSALEDCGPQELDRLQEQTAVSHKGLEEFEAALVSAVNRRQEKVPMVATDMEVANDTVSRN